MVRMATKQTLTQRVKALELHAKRGVAGYLILFVGMLGALFMDNRHASQERQNNRDARAALVQQTKDNQKVNRAARQSLVDSGNAISVYGCNRDYRTIRALRGIIVASRLETQKAHIRGEISPGRYRSARQFYRTTLRRLRVPDCRDAADILNDDPDAPIRSPEPLWVGKKG